MEPFKRWVEVSFQREAIHCFPSAPAEVEYLKHPHRHVFHFYAKVQVWHNDRDIEFIMLKRELEARYMFGDNVDYKSCEMLAEGLIDYLVNNYPGRDVTVGVYEDDENGAIIEYRHPE